MSRSNWGTASPPGAGHCKAAGSGARPGPEGRGRLGHAILCLSGGNRDAHPGRRDQPRVEHVLERPDRHCASSRPLGPRAARRSRASSAEPTPRSAGSCARPASSASSRASRSSPAPIRPARSCARPTSSSRARSSTGCAGRGSTASTWRCTARWSSGTSRRTTARATCCAAVRAVVGPDVPIVATCDLHSLLTETMLEQADAIVWFKTYPHVDMADRAVEAARLLARTVRGEIKPTVGHRTAAARAGGDAHAHRDRADAGDRPPHGRARAERPGAERLVQPHLPIRRRAVPRRRRGRLHRRGADRAAELAGELAEELWRQRERSGTSRPRSRRRSSGRSSTTAGRS